MKKILFPLSLVLLILLAYSPCLSAGFLHWDDDNHIITNPLVYAFDWQTLIKIFAQTVNETYIPLTILSYNIEYHIFGLMPWAIHLDNVLLHAIVTLLVFRLATTLGLTRPSAFIASAFFALHPLHVESVAWATERKDVLYAIFYLLSMLQYWHYLNTNNKKNYGLALCFGLLAILAKPMAVSLPWILLLLDLYKGRKWSIKIILDKIPFALIIFPIASITFLTLSPHLKLIFPDSLLILIWSNAFYLEKFIWPFPLLPVYTPPEPVMITNPVYALATIVLLAVVVSFYIFRHNRLWVFACLFYAGSIFFFWRYNFADINIVADRFMYLPSLGLCLALGSYLGQRINNPLRRRTGIALLSGMLILLGTLSFLQCRIWQDDITLWQWALNNEPHNSMARKKRNLLFKESTPKHIDPKILKEPATSAGYTERGVYFLQNNNARIALWDFNKALELDPNNAMAYDNRGGFYQLKEKYPQALKDFDKAIALKPNNGQHYLNKGITLTNMGRYEESLPLYAAGLKLNPTMKDGYYRKGLLLRKLKRDAEALIDFNAALAIHPFNRNFLYQRGLCLAALGQYKAAIDDFKTIVRIEPLDPDAYNEMGVIYLQQKNLTEALQAFNKAIAIDPYDPQPYNNIAVIALNLQRYDDAIKAYSQSIRFDPTPYRNLISRADLYAATGESKLALKDYTRAINLNQHDNIAMLKRAGLYYKTGKYQQALKDIRLILTKDPINKAAHLGEIDILRAINRDR